MSWYERWTEAFAKTRAGGWLAVHVGNPIDQRLVPLTNGRFGTFLGAPVGLLETVGAKSGQRRKTPLLYLDDGERVVLVASKAGAARHPSWLHNLRANPRVSFLRRGGHRGTYVAREAERAERDQRRARVHDLYAGYDTYQGRTPRKIPIVVLDPAD